MKVRTYSQNPLRPAYNVQAAEAALRPVSLPIGGGTVPLGTVLGHVGGAVANEVWAIAINSGTGTLTFTFTADKVYTTTFSVSATLAAVKAALETIFGTDNVAVTGTPGTSYTITFQNGLAGRKVNVSYATVATSGGSGTAITESTAGSCGAGQFGVYDNSSPGVARCVLKYAFACDPTGARVTELGSTGQPAEAQAYFAGYFFADTLVGLDAAAVSDPGWRLVEGNAITDPGAVVGIGV